MGWGQIWGDKQALEDNDPHRGYGYINEVDGRGSVSKRWRLTL
jgi:hypothetical protein